MRENKYYNTEIDIIADFMAIFDIIPTGESRTVKAFKDQNGNIVSKTVYENCKTVIKYVEVELTYPINRRANTDEEFAIVFENEFKKAETYDNEVFKERHIEICQAKRDELIRFNNRALEHHIHILDRYIKFLQSNNASNPKTAKKFSEYLKHPDPNKYAEKLKKEFPSVVQSGRDSAALMSALVKTDKLKYYESNQAIYDAMNEHFGYIGNYKGFNNYLNVNHQNNKNLKASGRIEKFIDILKSLE